MDKTSFIYDDGYETCRETFVTFRIYFDDISPNEISNVLDIKPSKYQIKGEKNIHSLSLDKVFELSGWFLSSKGVISSKDSRRHLDYILDLILPKKEQILDLDNKGAQINIDCFWASVQGHGGLILSKAQLSKLSELGLDFSYDFY